MADIGPVQFVCAYCRKEKGLKHKSSCAVHQYNSPEKWVDKNIKSSYRMTDST